MSSLSGLSVIWLAGLALIFVALVGGGIEVKEIKIPSITVIPRVLTFVCGIILFAIGFAVSNDLIPSLKPAGSSHASTDASLAPAPAQEPAFKPAPPPSPKSASGPASTLPPASTFVSAPNPTQPPTPGHLTADEITTLIVNHKFSWASPRGATGTVLYRNNKHAELTFNQGSISSDSGTWWPDGDKICVAWKRIQSANRCITLENTGNNRLRTSTGVIWLPL